MSVNLSCFQGGDRERWRLVANGASLRPHATRPDKWIENVNKAGYAIRTGGIVFPRETDLNPGRWYYRLMGIPFTHVLATNKHEGVRSQYC